MPNHCENTLNITGPAEDIRAFAAFAHREKEPLEINNFIPMPEELRNTESPNRDIESAKRLMEAHGVDNWYDWAVNNWGTKWGAYETQMMEVTDTRMEYIFLTAWGPFHDEVLRVMSERFPSLKLALDYEEQGMAFQGHCTAQGGKILETGSKEMDPETDDMRDETILV